MEYLKPVLVDLDTGMYMCLFLDSNTSRKSVSREQSVEVIHLDLLRTFPTLGFFQEVSTCLQIVSISVYMLICTWMCECVHAHLYVDV